VIYFWSGYATDEPVEMNSFSLTGLNVEAVLPVYEKGRLCLSKLQVLTDNGHDIYYGDTIITKNIFESNFKKFSSVIIESFNNRSLLSTPKSLLFNPEFYTK
jgi:hypothetical protein